MVRPSDEIVTKRSPVWTLREDLRLCGRVMDCGGLNKKLTPSWFRSNFTPMPEELLQRNLGALILRFNYLRDELLRNLAKQQREGRQGEPSWEWLEAKHERTLSKDYYTIEQDLALCQAVLDRGKVGQAVGQKWFRENVVGRVPVLEGRNGSGLYGRYSKRLSKRLSRAVLFSPAGTTSFRWLRELHGVDDPEADEREGLSSEQLQAIQTLGMPMVASSGRGVDSLSPTASSAAAAGGLPAHRQRKSKRPAKYDDEAPHLTYPRKGGSGASSAQSSKNSSSSGGGANKSSTSGATHVLGNGESDAGGQLMVLNVDCYAPIQLSLQPRMPLAQQLTAELLGPFGLSVREAQVLAAGLQQSVRGWPLAGDYVWVAQVDLDQLELQAKAMPEGSLLLEVRSEGEAARAVLAAGRTLAVVSALPRSAWLASAAMLPKAGRRSAAFTLAEDQALCQRVARLGQAAPRLQLQFFEEHVVDHVALLHGRPATSLMMRYNNHLQDGLAQALALARGQPVDYGWLSVRREAVQRPYGLEEHLEICQTVVNASMATGVPLADSWFRQHCQGNLLQHRGAASLAQEYLMNLQAPLVLALRQAESVGSLVSYQWLRDRHLTSKSNAANRPYSFEEDYALCQKIVKDGLPGKTMAPTWFAENIFNVFPELSNRSVSSLENRYRTQLKLKLGRAVRASESSRRPMSWSWLYKMHKISPRDRGAIARLTGATYRWRKGIPRPAMDGDDGIQYMEGDSDDDDDDDDDDEDDGMDEEEDQDAPPRPVFTMTTLMPQGTH